MLRWLLIGILLLGFPVSAAHSQSTDQLRRDISAVGDFCLLTAASDLKDKMVKKHGSEVLYRLAEQGNADASYLYALFLKEKKTDGSDLAKQNQRVAAFRRMKKTAEMGHGRGMSGLGYYYEIGSGVEKSPAKAIFWTKKSADSGCAAGEYSRGYQYHWGKGLPKDPEKAVYWYSLAVDQGYSHALFAMGNAYRDGALNLPVDKSKARTYYRLAVQNGHKSAARSLKNLDKVKQAASASPWSASQYLSQKDWSVGDSKDLLAKVKYKTNRAKIRGAAAAGNSEAGVLMAYAYLYGYGETKNEAKSRELFLKYAKKGNPRAMNAYGYYLEFTAKDRSGARSWYYKAYRAGSGLAAYNYAWRYEDDCDRSKNCYRAHHLEILDALKFAAEQGYPAAKKDYEQGARILGAGGGGSGPTCRTVYDPKCTPNGGCQYRARQVCN